jgi:hypothetical protein
MTPASIAASNRLAWKGSRAPCAPVVPSGKKAPRVAQVAPAAARDEHGAGLRRQPAERRPGADLGLGDEAARLQRIDDEDIEPGDVVGHHQRMLERRALLFHADAADGEQAARPAADARPPPRGAGPREHQRAGGQSHDQVEEDAEQADGYLEIQRAPIKNGWCSHRAAQQQDFTVRRGGGRGKPPPAAPTVVF